MTPDTSRWRSSPDYDYVDDLSAPDLAWEWLRRNDSYQQDFAQLASLPAELATTREGLGKWGLQFFRFAVADGSADRHLLVA